MEFIHTPLLFEEGTEKGYDRCGTSNTRHSMLSAQAANPATFDCEVYFCASAAICERPPNLQAIFRGKCHLCPEGDFRGHGDRSDIFMMPSACLQTARLQFISHRSAGTDLESEVSSGPSKSFRTLSRESDTEVNRRVLADLRANPGGW